MRRYLAALLLILFALQLPWAAAATYCEHESVTGEAHFGHHQCAETVGDQGSSRDGKAAGADHADCSACHLSAAKVLALSTLAVGAIEDYEPDSPYTGAYASAPRQPIDRPNWARRS